MGTLSLPMHECTKCGVSKPESSFEFRTDQQKRRKTCRSCMNEMKRNHYMDNPVSYKLREAKRRAKVKGLDFDLTPEDVIIPEYCPLLGIKLEVNSHAASFNSPSIDRIDSSKGYTKDNVWVISYRANTVKNDASYNELFTLVYNLYRKLKKEGMVDEEVSVGYRNELNSEPDLVLRN